jgi:hypothetical protein
MELRKEGNDCGVFMPLIQQFNAVAGWWESFMDAIAICKGGSEDIFRGNWGG